MKKLVAVSVLGILSVGAFAQDAQPLTFRLGLAFPTKGETRDVVSQMTAFGFQFKLSDLASTSDYKKTSTISIDYYGRGDYRHIPVMFNYQGDSTKGETFWSAGVGIGFVGAPVGSGTESVARFAYQASVGMNLSSGVNASFVEVKYFGSEMTQLNALGLYLGIKF